MAVEVWAAYVGAILVMMSTPGPSQLLILSVSLTNGFRRSLATACGDLSANVLQMLAAGLGLAALLQTSAVAFSVVKWAGVAYLVYLGLRMIRRSFAGVHLGADQRPTPLHRLWLRGFLTSAANPKAIVFFAALFPQFLDPALAFWPQWTILAITYLVIDGTILSLYAALADALAQRLSGRGRVWVDRIAGGSMIGAAVLLGLRGVQRT